MSTAVLTAMMTGAPGNNWTNTSMFKCQGVNQMPFHGNEILIFGLIYVGLITMYSVTFMDIALKQMWPAQFLDDEVAKRVKKLQAAFPGIVTGGAGGGDSKKTTKRGSEGSSEKAPLVAVTSTEDEADSEWDSVTKVVHQRTGAVSTVKYDKIVCQDPYIATCCIDEDLTFILANGDAFGTVSSYCTSTVRGYAMLSTMLPMVGTVMGFLWLHNAMIYPVKDNHFRYFNLAGYFLIFLTGLVMCGPNSRATHRNRNILLWGSIPLPNVLLDLHGIGFGGFMIVPMIGNFMQLLFAGADLPNRTAMWYGFNAQLIGLAAFGLPQLLKKMGKLTPVEADKYGILGEIVAFTASVVTFAQIETYTAAACAQCPTTFAYSIIGTMALVWGSLIAKKYSGAPLGPYTNDPSVLLMHYGTPVASSGPVPVLNYNREAAILPIIQPASQ